MRTKKEKEYVDYIATHQENVQKAFDQYGKEILGILKDEDSLGKLLMSIRVHDNSKFSDDEFDGYRKKFFPDIDDSLESADKGMDIAWLHHMNKNKHHPEYWVMRDKKLGNKPLGMPKVYIAEMILDWIAMGYNNSNSTALDWFNSNKLGYRTIMTTNTFSTTELVLTTLFGKGA